MSTINWEDGILQITRHHSIRDLMNQLDKHNSAQLQNEQIDLTEFIDIFRMHVGRTELLSTDNRWSIRHRELLDECECKLIEFVISLNCINIIHVRPTDYTPSCVYDAVYQEEAAPIRGLPSISLYSIKYIQRFSSKYLAITNRTKIVDGYVQKASHHFNAEAVHRFYLAIDSMYYLSDVNWKEMPKGNVYASFLEFPSLPGTYKLPGCSGQFSVIVDDSKLNIDNKYCSNMFYSSNTGLAPTNISMSTGGSGMSYQHPNVFLRGSELVRSLGFVSWNNWIGPTSALDIQVKVSPLAWKNFSTMEWAQGAYFNNL